MLFLGADGAVATHPGTTVLVDGADTTADGGGCGDIANPCDTIQAAVDHANAGDTVSVAPGTYDETIDVDGRSNISIVGQNQSTVIIQPTSTLCWNIAPYGCSRTAVVRVVNSTDITISDMTFDFDNVKANFVFGVLYWDSTGGINNNVLKNMSVSDVSGGYYEITSYIRAPGFTDLARANVSVTNNTFSETGRLAVVTHGYVDATISGNTMSKTIADFGYGIELGSESTGTITGNDISGYDTAAASDGSSSGAIYVENAFTGGSPHVNKSVLIQGNALYGNQAGLWIGNGFDGFAGNVDIQVTMSNNNIHDNLDAGVFIEDEDKAAGSSVTVNSSNDTVANNTQGYYFNTYGDGELRVDITTGNVTGNTTAFFVEDNAVGPSGSIYDLAANFNTISGNGQGVDNTVPSTFDATCNYWGANSGPSGTGPGSGDSVSINVTYDPWLPSAGASCQGGLPAVGGIAGLLTDSSDGPVSPTQPFNGDASSAAYTLWIVGLAAAASVVAIAAAGWFARKRLGRDV